MTATIPIKPFDLAAEHPACGQATAKLLELQLKRQQVDGDLNDALDAQRGMSRRRTSSVDLEAAALLEGAPHEEALTSNALREQIVALQHERAVLGRAIELQRRIVEDKEVEASKQIAARLAPSHRALVGEIAKSLVELGTALTKEEDLRLLLQDSGVRYVTDILRPMGIPALGDPRDRNSLISIWLREAIEYDLISESMVPQTWRLRWK